MNQLSYYVTKRLIVGSKDSSGTIIHKDEINWSMKPNKQNEEINFFISEWRVVWVELIY